jgi:hypothetical protein
LLLLLFFEMLFFFLYDSKLLHAFYWVILYVFVVVVKAFISRIFMIHNLAKQKHIWTQLMTTLNKFVSLIITNYYDWIIKLVHSAKKIFMHFLSCSNT